jgi:hypothetical protein
MATGYEPGLTLEIFHLDIEYQMAFNELMPDWGALASF